MTTGDELYLVVDPGALGDGGCDSTLTSIDVAGGGDSWSLSDHFRLPEPESGPWSYRQALQALSWDELDPMTYAPMPFPSAEYPGAPGLKGWVGEDLDAHGWLPAVVKNVSSEVQTYVGVDFEPGLTGVHPSCNRPAVVEWRGPVTGTVHITGTVTDIDGGGVDGVTSYVMVIVP